MEYGQQRRGFFKRLLAGVGMTGVAAPSMAQAQSASGGGANSLLPRYARALNYRSLKQSSFDVTGGNRDYWPIKAGATQEVFNQQGAAWSRTSGLRSRRKARFHLKELVLRTYWDGNRSPASRLRWATSSDST